MKKRGNPAAQGWDPIIVSEAVNPSTPMAKVFFESKGERHYYRYRQPQKAVDCFAFYNRLYNGVALVFEDGSMHFSFKRNDRAAVRDWRHFQAIKNSVAGPEREAVEIFPPESELVDGANEYHLWVLPEGVQSPLGLRGGLGPQLIDATDDMDYASYRQGGPSGARQRGWEPGIPTGLGNQERGGVIGSTADSSSVSMGSSPVPANPGQEEGNDGPDGASDSSDGG